MSGDRKEFLTRIKRSLQQALLPAATPEHPGSFQGYSYQTGQPEEELVDSFERELQALTGQVHRPKTGGEAISTLLAILESHQARRILAWDDSQLALPGLKAALMEAQIQIEDNWLPAGVEERHTRLTELDDVKVGLSGAQGGLADTGTLALISGPGRGRLASLLPPVHIALLPVRNMYPSLPAFLAGHPTAATDGSNFVLISGPSRTADIEMTLSLGVHGPKEVHAIIIP